MHDAYTIGIPVLVILIANFINRADFKELRAEMKELRGEINARFEKMEIQMERRFNDIDRRFEDVNRRFDAIDAELRYFHGVTGRLDGRIESIEKRQN